MSECGWCLCEVDERRADQDGNHLVFTDCVAALKKRVVALTHELVDERARVAELTERLECCKSCPQESA
jgi:hypothetical protein